VQQDRDRRERGGKAGEEEHDHENQPHVVGFPDRCDRVRDEIALRLATVATREEIPHASTEVSAREQHVRVERDHHDSREDDGKREGHAASA